MQGHAMVLRAQKLYRFESYNSVGLVANSQATHGLVQSVNGFSRGPWYAGIGLGIDGFRVRSVPLFADFRYRLGKGRGKWLAYSDLGYHFPWDDTGDFAISNSMGSSFKGGFYLDAGLGFQWAMGKRGHALTATAGYSLKNLSEEAMIIPFCPGPGICEPRTEYFAYSLNRYVFKIGWKF